MSASVETLSPSKHIIIVTPFNEMMKNNGMMDDDADQVVVMKREGQEEVEKKNELSTTSVNNNNNNADEPEKNMLALESRDINHAAVIESSPTPKASSSLQQQDKDKNNERRLQKWKNQHLGNLSVPADGGTDNVVLKRGKQDYPEVKVISISIKCRDRPDIILAEPFASSPKACLFTLKERSRYRLRFSFNVSNKAVSGLKYVNTLWKAGVRVDRSEVMLGSFNPKKEPYAYELEEDTAPSGIFVRGLYCARTKVVDDQDNCYFDIKYYFEIQKSWPSCC